MLYCFGNHALDTDRRELRRDGELVAIAPQVFDILAFLIRNRERVITKDDLIAGIWGGRIVSESALTTRLNGARKAIGDNGEEQRLIKTLPRKGLRFVGHVREEAPATSSPSKDTMAANLSLGDQPSIVVLPFANLSGDPLQDYFTDGIVEDITTELSRFSELFVIARNTSFTYKGQAVDVRTVGRDLGVRYALEGSVRKVNKRVRISGQLIDAETGKHIWADRFESSLDDIFELQDQMAHSVVGAIAPKLEQAEIERAKRKPTESLSAYDCFLRGMAGWHAWTRAGHDAALKHFYRSIELDPTFARPYALAAGCFLMRKSTGWVVDRATETAETDRLARLGADLGRSDAVALAWSAHAVAHVVGDIKAGVALIDHALRLNPNLAAAWQRSGWIRVYAGECELAIEHLRTAMRLSPLDPQMHLAYSAMAFAYFLLGDLDQSSTWSDRALQLRPGWPVALRVSAMSHALAGRERPKQEAMARLRMLQPNLRLSNLHEQIFLHRPEHMARFVEGMRTAGLPE
ncbi:winged helix-turn-helix domain-containing tetratricopeptide repeat protein [Bradyrhizobium sp. DOA1]|uniref:winged helix-turn-helix domain-containing tetratricopeptide repeat protein n=1 Tax=Bradyrhizobium sp. DOA1 TaxID=1126616 RepID=UPI00077C4DF5|nr:winged helix-turn-helix domain-containing tetratricopeptide repeat protein [Bradyrhizobium sp. DOA1]KYH03313.1 CadC-family transcriptional regulator [Bradyrhizobium sp. DOA1]